MNDIEVSTDDQPIHLTWRRLDRFASAAALGVVLAAPRSALLTVEMLRPRIQPTTSPLRGPADADTRRQEAGR
jgi:hypothetical protein